MPLSRSRYLMPLSREHHFSLLFGWKLKQGINHGVEVNRMVKYVAYFWTNLLLPHFKEEEEALFILSQDQEVTRALQEHLEIAVIVKDILLPDQIANNLKLLQLGDRVDAHVRFEERVLFPHLEKTLTEDQLKAVGESLIASEIVKDDFDDRFWETK